MVGALCEQRLLPCLRGWPPGLAGRLGRGQLFPAPVGVVAPNGAGVTLAMKRLPGSDFVKGGDDKPGWNVTFTSTRGWERDETKSYKPSTNRTTQGAICLQDRGNKLLACTSHFVSGSVRNAKAIQNASVKDLGRTAATWSKRGYRTVLGGDFSIDGRKERPRLAPLYNGNFEADSNDNAPTRAGRKIDSLFFNDRGWKLRGGDVRVMGKGNSFAYTAGRLSRRHTALTCVRRPCAAVRRPRAEPVVLGRRADTAAGWTKSSVRPSTSASEVRVGSGEGRERRPRRPQRPASTSRSGSQLNFAGIRRSMKLRWRPAVRIGP